MDLGSTKLGFTLNRSIRNITQIVVYMRYIASFLTFCVLFAISGYAQYGISEDYTQTLKEITQEIKDAHEQKNLFLLADAYYDRAMHNFQMHLRDQDVINDLIESARLYKRTENELGFTKARFALAAFYIEENIFLDDAIKLTSECYQFYKSSNYRYEEALAVTQLGRAHQQKLNYQKALAYIEEGLKASLELKNKKLELENRLLISRLLADLGRVEKVIEQASYIIKTEEELDDRTYSSEANFIIGKVLLRDERVQEAFPYIEEARDLNTGINEKAYEINYMLSELYNKSDNAEEAFTHLKRANYITNELYNQEKYAMETEIAVKYQTEEKEKEIKELEEENQLSALQLTKRTRYFIILSAIALLVAFSIFNYYRLQKHKFETERLLGQQKEEIAQQKINDLENQLKIDNLHSMITGQEAERSRISNDLHDSLGGMLSTLKLKYDTLQVEHEDLSEDNEYHEIMDLIDIACNDVRDISRNLKPNALENLGLTAALKDLVNRYRIRGTLDISINTNNVDGILDKEAKLHVYRIIQELLNNAVKHAKASEIDVFVNRAEDELVIMVQDNGKGFDQQGVKKGLGLGNLESRVKVLKGEMEIDSYIDGGTSVTVHIPLNLAFA